MLRQNRSEHSRRQVLDSALNLFSHQGYRATTMREIADEAGVSTGNVYHHFEDKEQIFRTLLDEFWAINDSKRYPYTRALASGYFPGNLEQLGLAARDSVREFRSYIALIYVDVIEFDGTHIQKFYGQMGQRYARMFTGGGLEEIRKKTDAKSLATLIISSLEGAVMVYRLERDEEPLRAVRAHLDSYLEAEVRAASK